MHELLTSTTVQHAQVSETLKILQGLCGMTPMRHLEGRLIFEGPKGPPLLPMGPAMMQSRKPTNTFAWKELNEQLLRQSYHLSVSYELDATRFGNSVSYEHGAPAREIPVMSWEEMRGTVHFYDIPDPQGTRPVNSRLMIQIKDESHLTNFLSQINYRYSSEYIREAYYAYRENVVFCISRDLLWPEKNETGPRPILSRAIPSKLPAIEEFRPYDGQNKWAFTASVQVSDGNQPVLMQKGLDQLAQVKQDFAGIFDFVVIPRHQLDTRVQSFNQTVSAGRH